MPGHGYVSARRSLSADRSFVIAIYPLSELMSARDVDHEFDGNLNVLLLFPSPSHSGKMHDEGPVKFLFDLMITDDAPYASGPDDQACSFLIWLVAYES
ncbi:hypothetical protein FOZ62_017767, partial [Perkinsus olseni]